MNRVEISAYRSWVAMRGRCLRPQKKDIKSYKGIKIDPKWNDFLLFLRDMGDRPTGTQLDRIDWTKGYFKENCRWVSPKEQARNRRITCFVEFNGVKKPLAEHCEEQGLRYGLVHRRIFNQGWKIEYALTVKSLPRGRKRRSVDKKFFI